MFCTFLSKIHCDHSLKFELYYEKKKENMFLFVLWEKVVVKRIFYVDNEVAMSKDPDSNSPSVLFKT